MSSSTWSRPRRVLTVAAAFVAALVAGVVVVRTGLTLVDEWVPTGPQAEWSYLLVALHGLSVWFGCSALAVVAAIRSR
jgi:hypothetical protein